MKCKNIEIRKSEFVAKTPLQVNGYKILIGFWCGIQNYL